ncbi:hypothetical protein F4810DRAFT_715748 [Camillea tinctor]|nr:hypothetical protein F4810DRAFT_715748 [Camillea tinctor]
MFEAIVQHFTEENWSLVAIALAFLIAIYGLLWSRVFGPGRQFYNPLAPRDFVANAENDAPPILAGRIKRAEAAMNNGLETLGFFAAAVVAANLAGVELWTMNWYCYAYLTSRIIYTWVYIYGQEFNIIPSFTRTAIWFCGIYYILCLYLTAGVVLGDPLEENATYWFSTAIKVKDYPVKDLLKG